MRGLELPREALGRLRQRLQAIHCCVRKIRVVSQSVPPSLDQAAGIDLGDNLVDVGEIEAVIVIRHRGTASLATR